MATSTIKALPKAIKLSGVNSIYATSDKASTGWVLLFSGYDESGKAFQCGFDATGGMYCYYDGALLWNIRP